MSDIVKGVSDLLASLVEIIKGIFVTIFNVAEGSIKAVLGLFKNIFNMAEGIVGFIIGMDPDRAHKRTGSLTGDRKHLHSRHLGRGVLWIYPVPATPGQPTCAHLESGDGQDQIEARARQEMQSATVECKNMPVQEHTLRAGNKQGTAQVEFGLGTLAVVKRQRQTGKTMV